MPHSATQLSSDLPQNLSVAGPVPRNTLFCRSFVRASMARLAGFSWQDALQNRNVQRVLRV
jgi:hypothetical protein